MIVWGRDNGAIPMANMLVQFWADAPLTDPPFVHPRDQEYVNKLATVPCAGFDAYVRSPYFDGNESTAMHIVLKPIPYAGGLDKEKIYLLPC
jgi:hypothetical protein